jgi:hypothetical protein
MWHQTDLHSYSKQPTAHWFFQSNFLVGKIMFSLSLLCKKNASQIQNYPCKYSLNWKPFRHKEMVATTNIYTSFWICCVILSKETLASVRVMNHVHSVTFLHRYIVSVDNKFRKTYLLWKRGQSISTETVMQFTEEHVNKRFQAHRFLYCVIY